MRFRGWVDLVNFGVVNWLTHRVLNQHWEYIEYDERTNSNSIQLDFVAHMEQLSNSSAHCWVHTSSIVEDIRKCVALYQEYEAGTVKKVKEGDAHIFEYFKYQVPGGT